MGKQNTCSPLRKKHEFMQLLEMPIILMKHVKSTVCIIRFNAMLGL